MPHRLSVGAGLLTNILIGNKKHMRDCKIVTPPFPVLFSFNFFSEVETATPKDTDEVNRQEVCECDG
jgi:hypothetical protein